MPRLAALVVGALTIIAMSATAQASELYNQALNQARDQMLARATLMSLKFFGYDGVTLFSMAFVNRGSYASIKTPLQAGTSYIIIGVGDDDARDVDVIVLAYASFTPRYGGNYTIFLKFATHHGDNAKSDDFGLVMHAILRV